MRGMKMNGGEEPSRPHHRPMQMSSDGFEYELAVGTQKGSKPFLSFKIESKLI